MSPGGLALARARREVEDMYVAVGRRILYWRIRHASSPSGSALPQDLGAFCRGAGISDLAGLLKFLGADGLQ